MTAPRPIQRALELRDAAPLKDRRPDRIFDKRLNEARELLDLAEEHAKSEAAKFEARRTYIVHLATAFEVYWREFFRATTDRVRPSSAGFSHLTKVTLTLAEMSTVLGRKLTLGELLSCAYSFRGVDALKFAASSVLQLDAFTEFGKTEYEIKVLPHKRLAKSLRRKIWRYKGAQILKSSLPLINECYRIRNETVHNTGFRVRLTRHEVFPMEAQMRTFNIFFSLFLQGRFEDKFLKKDA